MTLWNGNDDYFHMIARGLEMNKEEVVFTHPGPRSMLQNQIGAVLLRYLMELEKRGILYDIGPTNKEIVDAVTDIYSDKFVEILAGERPFNW